MKHFKDLQDRGELLEKTSRVTFKISSFSSDRFRLQKFSVCQGDLKKIKNCVTFMECQQRKLIFCYSKLFSPLSSSLSEVKCQRILWCSSNNKSQIEIGIETTGNNRKEKILLELSYALRSCDNHLQLWWILKLFKIGFTKPPKKAIACKRKLLRRSTVDVQCFRGLWKCVETTLSFVSRKQESEATRAGQVRDCYFQVASTSSLSRNNFQTKKLPFRCPNESMKSISVLRLIKWVAFVQQSKKGFLKDLDRFIF